MDTPLPGPTQEEPVMTMGQSAYIRAGLIKLDKIDPMRAQEIRDDLNALPRPRTMVQARGFAELILGLTSERQAVTVPDMS